MADLKKLADRYLRGEIFQTSTLVNKLAKYQGKKKLDSGNTVYMYSERQVNKRNKDKAEKLEKLRKNVDKLRAKVKKDLNSEDTSTALSALAVNLIDYTAERVGNQESADELEHVGVTGWAKDHITFSKGEAKIEYTGKSGVKQKKSIKDKTLVKALKKAYDNCEGEGIFCHEDIKIDASKVNAYLKEFDITAKDLRGLHANERMMEILKENRKGTLPKDKKDREKALKKEWKAAVKTVAEALGHTEKILVDSYIVPGFEDAFLKDGTILDKLT